VQTDGSHNVTEIKTYWPMGLGVEIDRPAQTASELDWTHTDHLGSVIAITDIDGNLKEALGYDTWGNRRNAAGAPVSIATTLTAEVNENTDDKGYTNAEQITSLELVHLNGRVYDPLIGKFLSGDPLVADPKNGQNYNRYAYVLNNPMNATDPTGFKDKMASICLAADYCGGSGGYDGLQGVDPGATLAGTTTTTFTPTSTTASTAPDGSITLTTTYSVSTDTVAGTGDATQGQTNAYASYTVAQANAATNTVNLAASTPGSGSVAALFGGDTNSGGNANGAIPVDDNQTLSATPAACKFCGTTIPFSSINWGLSVPSANGGYVIQAIQIASPGVPSQAFWEAWPVMPGTMSTMYSFYDPLPDDTFMNHPGQTVTASAQFFENYTLPSTFYTNPAAGSGTLPSTTVNPNLPTQMGTPPVNRTWTQGGVGLPYDD